MRAAVVTDFSAPPRVADFPEPAPLAGYVEVRPVAVGVHRVVRSTASGAHYSSGDGLPFVIGVDGVALDSAGHRVFTGGAPDPLGTMAERTLVPEGFAVALPEALDSVRAAGLVNPAMSSWMPLTTRADLQPGASVLVLGATGVAGRLAVRIALQLGARHVLAAGRNREILDVLDADPLVTAIDLGASPDPLPDALAGGVDVVLDYLWGTVAERALEGIRRRRGRPTRVQYAQIGALAGESIRLDAPLLRSSNVTIFGSGLGSIEGPVLMRELPRILDFLVTDDTPAPVTVPLEQVGTAWDDHERFVVTLDPSAG